MNHLEESVIANENKAIKFAMRAEAYRASGSKDGHTMEMIRWCQSESEKAMQLSMDIKGILN